MTSVCSTSLTDARIVVVLVHHGCELDTSRDFRLKLCECTANFIHRGDDVRARLAKNDEQDGGLAVGESGVANVGHGIGNLRDVAHAHGRAVVISHDQRGIVDRLEKLIVVLNRIGVLRVGEVALGHIGVRAGKSGAHLLEADSVFIKRERIQVHAHRRQRAPAHQHLADALKLRQLLRKDG